MEPAEFREIYYRYSPLVWAMIHRAGIPERDRDDVFMICWGAIHASLGSFRRRSNLATWIARLVKNKAVDWIRTRPPIPIGEEDILDRVEAAGAAGRGERALNPRQNSIRRETAEMIARFLERLPPRRKMIVEQWLDGCTYREIADRLGAVKGRPAETNFVGKELYTVRLRLQRLLAEGGIQPGENLLE